MHFQHAQSVWSEFPMLVPGVLHASGVNATASVSEPVERYTAIALERLGSGPESELPEIQAWRRTFSTMGLKPTQYRCASESLLRRLRKEGSLPSIHPLIDLCNAFSVAFAIPVAAIDLTNVSEWIEVRHASGDEIYETFSGETEHPAKDEVVFADAAGYAHARRWTNRQSGRSAIRESTSNVLIVAEAVHESAPADVARLVEALTSELAAAWDVSPTSAILTAESHRFTFDS